MKNLWLKIQVGRITHKWPDEFQGKRAIYISFRYRLPWKPYARLFYVDTAGMWHGGIIVPVGR